MLLLKIKYRLSLLYKTILFGMGLGGFLLRNRYGERILVFHSLDLEGNTGYNSRFIAAGYFEELIRHCSKNYNLLSLDDFYTGKFSPGILNIAITFDDGLLNNFELAAPILEKYNVPATFFITPISGQERHLWPDFLDLVTFYSVKKEIVFQGRKYRKNRKNEFSHGGRTLKDTCKFLEYDAIEALQGIFRQEWEAIRHSELGAYWKLMDSGQLRQLSQNPLFSIGAHGVTHANLVAIQPEKAFAEIAQSQALLKKITGSNVDSFAFPFGTYNDRLIECCKNNGFNKILLLDYEKEKDRHDPALKARLVVNPYISQKQLIASLLKGNYR